MDDNDKNQNLIDPNHEDLDKEESKQDLSELDDDLDNEDYDPDYKDDILKPASTRSKIVVNLREPEDPKDKSSKLKQEGDLYELDPYDEVRMKLYKEDQKFYKAYMNTIKELKKNTDLQPKKRQMPLPRHCLIILVEAVVLILVFYFFFLILQLALFNLVILGILFVFMKKLYKFAEACRWKLKFEYKTQEFNKFIERQNQEVYKDLNIKISKEREGSWLEFQLDQDDEMFEQIIQENRNRIFEEKNTRAIEDMKTILNEYKKKKELQQRDL
mmetsp:Transcript_17698/g.29935  ORF Transcript_17698/g.29935 Transcript_17698/m.29935 type:complete len:272 (-) Transcript_17698:47-862(-)